MKNKLEFDKEGNFTNLCIKVRDRIKEKNGFEPNSLNKILGYATDNERKELRQAFIDELEKEGNDRTEVEKLFDNIEADGIQDRIEREMALNDPTTHLYYAMPKFEPTYYRDMVGKHSGGCNRKPKARKKVKHGNRKKK